jgi:DNA-binding IclR family transcriptional regulator
VADLSKTVAKMVLILTTLGDGRTAAAREIAEHLGMNRTVAQRLLTTLHAQGFVARRGGDGYALSFRVQALGDRVLPELRQAALPVARDLATALGATVTLHVADGADAVVVAEHLPAHAPIQVRHVTGSRSPLVRGAAGRALLAFREPATIQRLVDAAATETEPDGTGVGGARLDGVRLREALAEVRRTGFATSREEVQRGARAVAAPVRDPADVVVASLALLFADVGGDNDGGDNGDDDNGGGDTDDTEWDATRASLAAAAREIEHRLEQLGPSD